jgi:hypothetical protein
MRTSIRSTILAIFACSALASAACTTAEDDGGDDIVDPSGDGKADGALPELQVTDTQRATLVTKGATCPFMRAAVALKQIRLHGTVEQPLANTADVVRLGNAGGGDLGKVLAFFAKINHNKIVGPGGKTTKAVPAGTFSVWFPGSNGAHPGHSGILMGNPGDVGAGRFAPERLARLTTELSTLYPDGKRYISREQIGVWIAQNVEADPDSRGFNWDGIRSLSTQVAQLLARAVTGGDGTLLEDTLHLLVTNNDLVNSCGEFALLFTRFADGRDADGDPLVSTDAIDAMFRRGVFPAGWDQRPAKAIDWVTNTLVITKHAIFASWGF